MAFSSLMSKIATSQCLLRGQTLGTAKRILFRSSAIVSNPEPLHKTDAAKNRPTSKVKISFLPQSFLVPVRHASAIGGREPEYKKHSHVMVWKLERILSAAMLGVIPAALIMPSQALDTAAALMIVLHTHWGLEAIVVDYIRPILFGDLAPKIGMGLLYMFSALSLAGLMSLIYNDIGLANTILKIWSS